MHLYRRHGGESDSGSSHEELSVGSDTDESILEFEGGLGSELDDFARLDGPEDSLKAPQQPSGSSSGPVAGEPGRSGSASSAIPQNPDPTKAFLSAPAKNSTEKRRAKKAIQSYKRTAIWVYTQHARQVAELSGVGEMDVAAPIGAMPEVAMGPLPAPIVVPGRSQQGPPLSWLPASAGIQSLADLTAYLKKNHHIALNSPGSSGSTDSSRLETGSNEPCPEKADLVASANTYRIRLLLQELLTKGEGKLFVDVLWNAAAASVVVSTLSHASQKLQTQAGLLVASTSNATFVHGHVKHTLIYDSALWLAHPHVLAVLRLRYGPRDRCYLQVFSDRNDLLEQRTGHASNDKARYEMFSETGSPVLLAETRGVFRPNLKRMAWSISLYFDGARIDADSVKKAASKAGFRLDMPRDTRQVPIDLDRLTDDFLKKRPKAERQALKNVYIEKGVQLSPIRKTKQNLTTSFPVVQHVRSDTSKFLPSAKSVTLPAASASTGSTALNKTTLHWAQVNGDSYAASQVVQPKTIVLSTEAYDSATVSNAIFYSDSTSSALDVQAQLIPALSRDKLGSIESAPARGIKTAARTLGHRTAPATNALLLAQVYSDDSKFSGVRETAFTSVTAATDGRTEFSTVSFPRISRHPFLDHLSTAHDWTIVRTGASFTCEVSAPLSGRTKRSVKGKLHSILAKIKDMLGEGHAVTVTYNEDHVIFQMPKSTLFPDLFRSRMEVRLYFKSSSFAKFTLSKKPDQIAIHLDGTELKVRAIDKKRTFPLLDEGVNVSDKLYGRIRRLALEYVRVISQGLVPASAAIGVKWTKELEIEYQKALENEKDPVERARLYALDIVRKQGYGVPVIVVNGYLKKGEFSLEGHLEGFVGGLRGSSGNLERFGSDAGVLQVRTGSVTTKYHTRDVAQPVYAYANSSGNVLLKPLPILFTMDGYQPLSPKSAFLASEVVGGADFDKLVLAVQSYRPPQVGTKADEEATQRRPRGHKGRAKRHASPSSPQASASTSKKARS